MKKKTDQRGAIGIAAKALGQAIKANPGPVTMQHIFTNIFLVNACMWACGAKGKLGQRLLATNVLFELPVLLSQHLLGSSVWRFIQQDTNKVPCLAQFKARFTTEWDGVSICIEETSMSMGAKSQSQKSNNFGFIHHNSMLTNLITVATAPNLHFTIYAERIICIKQAHFH